MGDERHGRCALGRAYTHGKLKAASGRLRENRAGSSAQLLGVILCPIGCGAEQTTACLGEVRPAGWSVFGRLPGGERCCIGNVIGGFPDAAFGVLVACASVETSAVELAEAAVVAAL